MDIDSSTVAMLNKSEIDMQISTAKKYPRSIKSFRNEAMQMVTLNESVADSCIYAIPRGGETIEGPSARFAEVIASAWGNCRAGARVVSDSGEFITAQGVFHDLERNVSITYEVQRRITYKNGTRFAADMIGVTGNAASSIALRNAILRGVPKAFWDDMYQAARSTVMGDFKTLANRRSAAIKAFISLGVTEQQVLDKLGASGVEDINLEHLVTLRGMITAIKDGDTTPEQAFAVDGDPIKTKKPIKEKEFYPAADFEKKLPGWIKIIADGKKTADQMIATAGSKHPLTDDQKAAIKKPIAGDGAGITFASVMDKLQSADNVDDLDLSADLIGEIADEAQRAELMQAYKLNKNKMGAE